MIRAIISGLLGVSFFSATLAEEEIPRVYAPAERAYSAFGNDLSRQFDFWIGEWDVVLKMIQDDLSFKPSVNARVSIYSILDGKAILELWDSEPIKGYSLRYYDAEQKQWVLWLSWPSKNRSGISSLSGEFTHGRGTFHSEFTNAEGQLIKSRFAFSDITPFSLRWDDLYSNDGGKTWNKNWKMEFTRTAVDPGWPIDPDNTPTFVDGNRCDQNEFRPYEALTGHWTGTFNQADATFNAHRILDGCAVMAFMDTAEEKLFFFLTFNTTTSQWVTTVLDERKGFPQTQYSSTDNWLSGQSENSEVHWQSDNQQLTLEITTENSDSTVRPASGTFIRSQE